MKSYSYLLAGSLLALIGFGQATAAELPYHWSCAWKGSWGVKGNPAHEPMSMSGFMFAADGGWVVRANSKDNFGPSHLRGGCGDGECWMEQKYTAGQGKGTSYHFKLFYKEKGFTGGVRTINYGGTWGNSEDADKHEGLLELTASCKPVGDGDDEAFAEQMSKSLGWDDESY